MFHTGKQYFHLLKSFFRASAIADMEYRLNFVLKILTDIIWYVAQISVFQVLFNHTTSISGWTLESTRVFMGVLFVTDSLWMMFFSENLDRLSDKVRKGELDLILVKPINAQFMMSTQKMSPAYFGNFILTLSWLTWSLLQVSHSSAGPIAWSRMLLLFVLIPCGLAINYSIKFFFSATAIIFTRAENINYIFYQLYRLGTRPDTIYPMWLRYVVLTILPVGFVASVPSRILLGEPLLVLLFSAITVAIIAVYLTTRYWRYTLRFYSSASS
jgi:ABC-2 type transport system permease protein